VLTSLRDLIASGGPLPDDLLGDGNSGSSTFVVGQAVNLEAFQGTIFPCKAEGRVSRYLGVTSTTLVELEAHKTKYVNG